MLKQHDASFRNRQAGVASSLFGNRLAAENRRRRPPHTSLYPLSVTNSRQVRFSRTKNIKFMDFPCTSDQIRRKAVLFVLTELGRCNFGAFIVSQHKSSGSFGAQAQHNDCNKQPSSLRHGWLLKA